MISLKVITDKLVLIIITPTGKNMSIVVCEEPTLISILDKKYHDGVVFLTLPVLQQAISNISFCSYLAHMLKTIPMPELQEIESKKINVNDLPPC